jgi:CRISPR system Cascade subunit CasA
MKDDRGLAYSLVDRPAVPVDWLPGAEGPLWVSLREVVTRAHEIAGLALPALDLTAVVTQLLLPLVLDAYGPPGDESAWMEKFSAGRFEPKVIDDYFTQHGHRFDLFASEAPFGQVGGLHTAKGETRPTSVLLIAETAGNSVPLFSARTDADPRALTPGEAFIALLSAQAFDTAAIKSGAVGDPQVKAGKTTGNRTGHLGSLGLVVLRGKNLFETVMLNSPLGPEGISESDAPHWRQPPPTPTWRIRSAAGILDLLTWQARRIRLIPAVEKGGQITVREVVLTAGDRLTEVPAFEPRTLWRQNDKRKPGEPPRLPARHQSGRTGWRGLAALLATHVDTSEPRAVVTTRTLAQLPVLIDSGCLPSDYPLDVLLVGVQYGTQSAVVENVIVDSLPLPVRAMITDGLFHRTVLGIAQQAEMLRRALNQLDADLRRAAGGDPVDWDKGRHPGDEAAFALDGPVREFLMAIRADPDDLEQARHRWESAAWEIVGQTAATLLAGQPDSAFAGRTVKSGSKELFMNTIIAERFFRAKVRQALPVIAAERLAQAKAIGRKL